MRPSVDRYSNPASVSSSIKWIKIPSALSPQWQCYGHQACYISKQPESVMRVILWAVKAICFTSEVQELAKVGAAFSWCELVLVLVLPKAPSPGLKKSKQKFHSWSCLSSFFIPILTFVCPRHIIVTEPRIPGTEPSTVLGTWAHVGLAPRLTHGRASLCSWALGPCQPAASRTRAPGTR